HLFFFQAEDGIRDRNVTGVQTCALPISQDFVNFAQLSVDNATKGIAYNDYEPTQIDDLKFEFMRTVHPVPAYAIRITDKNGKVRSEERRVGKEWRCGWWRET